MLFYFPSHKGIHHDESGPIGGRIQVLDEVALESNTIGWARFHRSFLEGTSECMLLPYPFLCVNWVSFLFLVYILLLLQCRILTVMVMIGWVQEGGSSSSFLHPTGLMHETLVFSTCLPITLHHFVKHLRRSSYRHSFVMKWQDRVCVCERENDRMKVQQIENLRVSQSQKLLTEVKVSIILFY